MLRPGKAVVAARRGDFEQAKDELALSSNPNSTVYVDAFNALAPLNLEQRGRALGMLRAALRIDAPRRQRKQRGPNRFRDKEIQRAMRAVTDTGAIVERVEVDPASGRISVIVASPG